VPELKAKKSKIVVVRATFEMLSSESLFAACDMIRREAQGFVVRGRS